MASDYAKFYPTAKRYKETVKKLIESEALFCIDWEKENFELYGEKESGSHYSQVEVTAVPCHMKETEIVYSLTEDSIRDDCIIDK